MSVEELNKVDFVSFDKESGDVLLTISDHLAWDENEGEHIFILQEKIITYLRFIESGELLEKFPKAKHKKITIDVFSKFPLSPKAELFFDKIRPVIENAGFKLQHRLHVGE